MGEVVVVGSINQDVFLGVADFVAPGETIVGHDLRYAPGGKGANQAVAAARAGAPTRLLSAVGEDAPGTELVEFLRAEGVGVDGVQVCRAATGMAFIQVAAGGENAIVVAAGANSELVFDDAVAALRPGDQVLATLEVPVPAILDAFRCAQAVGAKTVLNAAPALAFPAELMDLTDCLVVNETELAAVASSFAGIQVVDDPSFAAALEALSAGARSVVATLGSRGVRACSCGEMFSLPGHAVPVVDTTGAGDTFVGWLAAQRLAGRALGDALALANAAAALAVGAEGAAPSIPRAADVERWLDPAGSLRGR